jgi:ectoine hydroxylase-related dioxygenase (phytanoyl-CoA dioxygenase family)
MITGKVETLLPSEQNVAFYEAHGWYVSQKVIPDSIIDEALQGSERFYAGERDAALPVTTGFCDWKPEHGDTIRNNEFISLRSVQIRQLALQPVIGQIAARLARARRIRLFDDQLVYKPPRSAISAVGWHADHAYWSTCTSGKMLTAWIPFHDCDESMGPLIVLDGSHRWPGIDHLRGFKDQELERTEERFRRDGRKLMKVVMALKKGQVSFHHGWAIHGSHPNLSDVSRVALAVHLQDDENMYRLFRTVEGRQIELADDRLCRRLPNGDPDYSDPAVFPLLWSEDES